MTILEFDKLLLVLEASVQSSYIFEIAIPVACYVELGRSVLYWSVCDVFFIFDIMPEITTNVRKCTFKIKLIKNLSISIK